MAAETPYQSVPYLYRSEGLDARHELDRVPPYRYIDFLNIYERDEESVSSRYGTVIVNRDPNGTPSGQNYFFDHPITSIARINYQSSTQRYCGLSDGSLWTRQGDTQGEFTNIYRGLSGSPFGWLVNNTYASSQPWLFIYDADASIKTALGAGNPELTGIDPPPITANAIPYAPLLTLIDNFASSNSYTTSNVTGWAWASITNIPVAGGQLVTDFPQFSAAGSSYTENGVESGVNLTFPQPPVTTYSAVITFPSAVISSGEAVSLSFQAQWYQNITGSVSGSGSVQYQYSVNSGGTWLPFFTFSGSGAQPVTNQNLTVVLPSVSNLDTVQVRVATTTYFYSGTGSILTEGNILTPITATINTAGIFGKICDGMLSILGTQAPTSVPISSISATGGPPQYVNLLVTTQIAHGLTTGDSVAIYGTSNDLCDGYYTVRVTGSTTFTVPFRTSSPISATGGNVWFYAGGVPECCVVANLYSTPWPPQLSAWGFYSAVPITTTSLPISAWSGSVAASTTGTIGNTIVLDLSQSNQVTDDDLIVLTLQVSDPNNISNIAVQFDVNGSGYTSSYYSANIAPAYYQANIAGDVLAYQATENQILADTLGLLTGQPVGSTTAQLQPSNLSTGAGSWAAVYIPRGNFLPVGTAGQSGLDWSNITGWQVVVTTNSEGSATFSVNGLYLQWGYGPSSYGGVGYDYRYTYFDASTFTESSPSPMQSFSTQYGYLASQSAPFFLRQAAQVSGKWPIDTQDTHVRMYRRGGNVPQQWVLIDQIPIPDGELGGAFAYKDVVADAVLLEATPLVLDNDPPVTSTLPSPITTTLAAATISPGSSIYSVFYPQNITTSDNTAVFVQNQVVEIGTAANLEQVIVESGGTGSFTAVLRLQHNAGEPVNVYSTPRTKCTLCAIAYGRVWVAGDPNNPHYLYFSKEGMPENFGPQNYIPVSSPDDPIMAVINWRGTLICGTLKSWYIIVGGSQPYAQATGAQHGIVASQGWAEVESSIWFRAQDGLREFTGANAAYMTLPVEWIYRGNPNLIAPQADPTQASQDVMAYYDNQVFVSYISTENSGQRFRLVYHCLYKRFRYDDVPATAMLWERDTNTLVVGKEISAGNYALCIDQVNDYDDGGWSGGSLVQTPINIAIQSPYLDIGSPHNPKQWNAMECDVNTQGQVLNTELLFDSGSNVPPITLATINTGTLRQKAELQINEGAGAQAYRLSVRHTMAVTVAPTLYQEDIHAMVLQGYDSSFDTYWLKPGGDLSVFVKQGYFDYTSDAEIDVSLYADQSAVPYFTFTLPIQNVRAVQRVRFGNLNPAAPAFNCRQWRAIGTCTGMFQMWSAPRIEYKPIGTNGYKSMELVW